jgi:hypothetical protein
MKVVIVGGVAGGASCAARRIEESFGSCLRGRYGVKRVANSKIRSQRGKEKGS